MNNNLNNKVVGIDLGTTNSCISFLEYNQTEPTVIKNRETGSYTTPSVVYVKNKNNIIIGEEALNQAIIDPEKVFVSIKREMGKNYSKTVDGVKYTPELISSFILSKLSKSAKEYLGSDIKNCVITVPAYFNENQRSATKNAGILSKLNVQRIINEPTAAALYYFSGKVSDETKVLVYDLGGGTFDVTILEASGDLRSSSGQGIIRVLSTNGDNRLGGDDFDNIIANIIKEEIRKSVGNLVEDGNLLSRIRFVARQAKEKLSFVDNYKINIPFVTKNFNYSRMISRSEFENKSKNLMDKCHKCIEQALIDAKLGKNDISQILLVGGSTRIPAVHKQIFDIFNKKPNSSLDPDCVVAKGAALQGAILSSGLVKDGQKKSIVLVDVNPLSLGIRSEYDKMIVIIPNNTSIPTSKTEKFTNASDYQSACDIEIYQGQNKFVNQNHRLGSFRLPLKPLPRGQASVLVTMKVDVNNMLTVTAKDESTNIVKDVKIRMSRELSKADIEKMFQQAKEYENSEKIKEQKVNVLNNIDGMFFSLKAIVDDKKIPESNKTKVKDFLESFIPKFENIKGNIDSTDISKINELKDKIFDFQKNVINDVYSKAQQNNTQNNDQTNTSNNDSSEGTNSSSFEEMSKNFNKDQKTENQDKDKQTENKDKKENDNKK
jgi:molecular chaperone DnaK